MSQTKSFGTPKRESHDSSPFYERNLYNGWLDLASTQESGNGGTASKTIGWIGSTRRLLNKSSAIPDDSVALAFTSPPYNVGKDYDDNMDIDEYLGLIRRVAKEVYRVLKPGGRYVVNVANLGRKPYIPLHHSSTRFMWKRSFCRWVKSSGVRERAQAETAHGAVGGARRHQG